MTDIGTARAALHAGDLDRATQLFTTLYDRDPGGAATGLARVALRRGDAQRAENLARTAMENGAPEALALLAQAVGEQGRRQEAEQLAQTALQYSPDSGVVRAILGEQRIRRGEWDLGTQDFIDALTLDGRGEVIAYLHRVLDDLVRAARAEKLNPDQALGFVNRVEYSSPQGHGYLARLFAAARRAINSRTHLEIGPPNSSPEPPPVPGEHVAPPSRAVSPPAPSRQAPVMKLSRASGSRNVPPLVAVMQRDRKLNEQLQTNLDELGLPIWPSENRVPLDATPPLRPTTLQIDPKDFQRAHLNLTTGAVDSEILIERALQALLRSLQKRTASAPSFDEDGLTQVEIAFWDGALEQMRPIPEIYYGEQEKGDPRVLAIGAFLGEAIVRRGTATWTFARKASDSVVETLDRNFEPFEAAREWLAAENKDDVHLERILGEARGYGQITELAKPRHDPTEAVSGRALAMKLAEQWLLYRIHPMDTAQNDLAAAIRPLNVLDDLIFFALNHQYAPPMAAGHNGSARQKDEVALAYLRGRGTFLCLGSRKHFARAVGSCIGSIEQRRVQGILDMFTAFHRPGEKPVRVGDAGPRIEKRNGGNVLSFNTQPRSGGVKRYALVHQPQAAVEWRLLHVEA